MPPKKAAASGCPILLPHKGKPCPGFGHLIFGTQAPACVTHTLALTLAVAAYFWYTGDVHYAGFVTPWIEKLGVVYKVLPANTVDILCKFMMVDCLLCCFPSPFNRLMCKLTGLCGPSIQTKSVVKLLGVGAFHLSPFDGFPFLCFAMGYITAMFFNIKKPLVKWFLVSFAFFFVKLAGHTAAAAGTISNFHHAMIISAWLLGAVSFASMGAPHGGKAAAKPAARGRSASAKRK